MESPMCGFLTGWLFELPIKQASMIVEKSTHKTLNLIFGCCQGTHFKLPYWGNPKVYYIYPSWELKFKSLNSNPVYLRSSLTVVAA